MSSAICTQKVLLDFHTHNRTQQVKPEAIASYSLSDVAQRPLGQPFTVGLHPWETLRLDAEQWVVHALLTYLQEPDCLALGEVGLDRLRGASIVQQNVLLAQQLELARHLHKPVVVHCVRAWSELRQALRAYPYPKAVHGFVGKEGVLKELLDDGWYISIKRPKSSLLALIPPERLLLETDDTTTPIQAIYADTARVLGCDIAALQQQVAENIQRFLAHNTCL